MPKHTPGEEVLMDYAAGSLPEPLSLVVATHLALSPESRAAVADYEAIGGALLETIEPVDVADDALAAVMARLERPGEEPIEVSAQPVREHNDGLPRPLADYLAGDLDSLPWRTVMRGLEEADVETGDNRFKTRLMRIAPGTAMPRHSHAGTEVTLVLKGAFSDEDGHYGRGDVQVADEGLDHRPVAEEGEPCICLVVTDAPVRLTGPVGRWLNPFIRY